MAKFITAALAILIALTASGERKVSKIYEYNNEPGYPNSLYQIQELAYDSQGRLISWKEGEPDGSRYYFDHTIEYIDDSHVRITGLSDGDQSVIDVTLDSNGLASEAVMYKDGKFDANIRMTYQDGLMTGLTWRNDESRFTIVDGNPTGGIRGGDNEVAYTDLPNKCGMAYLPIITCNTAWQFRSIPLAGLEGHGSRNLPYSCHFKKSEAPGIIDYEFDPEGYVLSMNITNSYDGDGLFKFEYCEVASTDMISTGSNTVTIRGDNGNIIIDGVYTSAHVYDPYGTQRGMTNLTPGLYIVKVDGNPHKILLR